MTEKKRPNVVGKGPVLSREMIAIFKEIQEDSAGLSDDLAGKISAVLGEKGADLEKVVKMAYLKTVKAGEVAWDLKEETLNLKETIAAGDEAKASELLGKIDGELDAFIHKIKTFVVRMT
ncbi:MAG: hypothetical protein LJE96_16035 [Deltaproteobacteria bacterium]|jgi:hypothetical protein|nr:hypothetical protein [Deltaproteobacteria bacterium]